MPSTMKRGFRGEVAAASLKPISAATHAAYSAGFRGEVAAASLKQDPRYERIYNALLFPRRSRRGLIEATLRG